MYDAEWMKAGLRPLAPVWAPKIDAPVVAPNAPRKTDGIYVPDDATRHVVGLNDKPTRSSHPRSVAVVTSASDPSALAMCDQLAKAGYTVVLTCRDQAAGKALAQRLRKQGGDVVFQRLDVDNPRSLKSLAGYIEQTYGRVDLLVNHPPPVRESSGGIAGSSSEALKTSIEGQVLGALAVVQALGPMMKKAKSGQILNVSSKQGRMHALQLGSPADKMAKAAINTMTAILADELKDAGIKINTLDVGSTNDSVAWLANEEIPSGAFVAHGAVQPSIAAVELPKISRTKPPPAHPVALVTGGTAGMGLETCRQLAEQGYRVVMTGRSEAKGEALAEAMRAEGLDVAFEKLDVAIAADADRVAAKLKAKYGGVDVVINNAGVLHEPLAQMGDRDGGGLLAIDPQKMSATLETNTLGPINLAKSMAPLMKARGGGKIINISSLLAREESLAVGLPAYRISKAALNVATVLLAKELAADGITVNAVDPGWVKTSLGGDQAPKSVREGARTAVWLATSEAGAVETGGFFEDERRSRW